MSGYPAGETGRETSCTSPDPQQQSLAAAVCWPTEGNRGTAGFAGFRGFQNTGGKVPRVMEVSNAVLN